MRSVELQLHPHFRIAQHELCPHAGDRRTPPTWSGCRPAQSPQARCEDAPRHAAPLRPPLPSPRSARRTRGRPLSDRPCLPHLSTRAGCRWSVRANSHRSRQNSVWSVDLFRVESILLRSHWVMLVMDVFTRRIIGFGIAPTSIDGMSVCRMFNCATAGQPKPKYLSTDHDPLFRFTARLANLRVLEIEEIKSVPSAPVSHPFVERLIGTIRRDYVIGYIFWNAAVLARQLARSQMYYNCNSSPTWFARRLDPRATRRRILSCCNLA